jgi:hypothetical protein
MQDGWQELDASSRGSSEMARDWRGQCPAVDYSGLMMMMIPLSELSTTCFQSCDTVLAIVFTTVCVVRLPDVNLP